VAEVKLKGWQVGLLVLAVRRTGRRRHRLLQINTTRRWRKPRWWT